MILPIVAYGDPVLREICEDIQQGNELTELIADMFETMYNAQGVGLAAPQIGRKKRVFIVDASAFAEDEKDPDFEYLKGFKKVFINAEILEENGEEWVFEEGCLSIPTIREDVKRPPRIIIRYFDENFNEKTEEFTGLPARVIQHEYDHIEGILFTDHLSPLKRRFLQKKLGDISKGKVSVKYKMKFPIKKR